MNFKPSYLSRWFIRNIVYLFLYSCHVKFKMSRPLSLTGPHDISCKLLDYINIKSKKYIIANLGNWILSIYRFQTPPTFWLPIKNVSPKKRSVSWLHQEIFFFAQKKINPDRKSKRGRFWVHKTCSFKRKNKTNKTQDRSVKNFAKS